MTTVAILGTGLMGYPLAERFLSQGFEVRAWNRTKARAKPLAAKGAIVASTPAEAVDGAEVIVLMLAAVDAIRHTLFEGDPVPSLQKRTVIQMGTIAPDESREIAQRVSNEGGDYFEAPVLGSPVQVREGELLVMVGGTREQMERWRPLLKCLCHEPMLAGTVGKAAALKLALNQLIAAHMAAFSLSFGFVLEEGVNPEVFLRVLRQSALYAPMFDNKLPRLLSRDFSNPNFPVKHMLKDVDLFLRASENLPLDTAALEGIRSIIQNAIARGLGERDYSALSEAVREKSASKVEA